MIIFLKKIPANTLPSELHDFVAPALKGGLFTISGRVKRAEILLMENKSTNLFDFHGLIHVDSEKAGKRAIQRLKGKLFKKRAIQVKEYILRNWHNDPRQNEEELLGHIQNQRRRERRGNPKTGIIRDIPVIVTAAPAYSNPAIGLG
jgi:hypothetical protein